MKRILVTGFEAFGEDRINASWEAVEALPDVIGETEIVKWCLPVEYDRVEGCLKGFMEELEPNAVVCVGQAAGRTAITPEKAAINWMASGTADNAGVKYEGVRICDDEVAADGYFASLPVEKIEAVLKKAGIPAQVSYTAGTYVCNRVMYGLLRYLRQQASPIKGGFIHVPCSSDQGAENPRLPSMSKEMIAKGLETALEVIAKA
ncbi:MAG: pyroglutamyl-peptidase I [Lachnospiraceae bacterium]|jgi:pyroglutamyl-peptidase|nr:pyroglutamyl-peptidase I [Lachnospiraceae bacterium]